MNIKSIAVCFGLFSFAAVVFASDTVTNVPAPKSGSTNSEALPPSPYVLAFYLETQPFNGKVDQKRQLKWNKKPILSDADFVGWDLTNRSPIITPKAAVRICTSCGNSIWPTMYLLMIDGKPILRGNFNVMWSSVGCAEPRIAPDSLLFDLGLTEAELQKAMFSAEDREKVLESSAHATNAVTLLPAHFDDQVRDAVKKLLKHAS